MNPQKRVVVPINPNAPPYTEEQMMNTPYVGTTLEQIDRAAGGPELRRKVRELAKKVFLAR